MKYYSKNILSAIIKDEFEACTDNDSVLLNNWYDELDDDTIFKNLDINAIDQKKETIWSAIVLKIGEEKNIVEFASFKFAYGNLLRVAAMLTLIIGSYLVYNNFKTKSTRSLTYYTYTNKGTKPTKIILPDNSLVWLQPKSAIKYPKYFINSRIITLLSGKVFFNIKHDYKKPFIVKSVSGIKTTVLGTAFVIEYEKARNSFKVSVLRGKVRVSDKFKNYATLIKNQGVNVNIGSKKAITMVADSLVMTKWFNSKVVLDNVSLKIVAATIKENYGINMEYSSQKLLNKSCSITYNSTDNLDDILSLLDKIYHTKHAYSNDSTVYIKPINSMLKN